MNVLVHVRMCAHCKIALTWTNTSNKLKPEGRLKAQYKFQELGSKHVPQYNSRGMKLTVVAKELPLLDRFHRL